ncbi:hypothetical protein HMPREF0027_2005 [Actinobacillus ureae ATCC 25976]|uniref:Uncharacterized protein n=1 Tax=Actinobacillus ureae ATCC 25976 TaxID=887324 RepID=E8KJI8_9PAST|nr:hypothetical protein HMPREF0027_2005 [Actinobacillus ureae ATCC 25976]
MALILHYTLFFTQLDQIEKKHKEANYLNQKKSFIFSIQIAKIALL